MASVPAPRFSKYCRGSSTCTKIRSKVFRRWFASMGAEKGFQRAPPAAASGRAASAASQDPLDQRLQPYLQHFEQRLGTFQQQVDAQQERAVNDILANWSRGKEFYEEVRGEMAANMSSGAMPLKSGAVDLDGAYAFAYECRPGQSVNRPYRREDRRRAETTARAR